MSSRSTEPASVNVSAYTHGLNGVDTPGNFFFVNLCVAFFFILVAVSLAFRLWKICNNHLRQLILIGQSTERQDFFAFNANAWWPWIKRHVLYAPLWRRRHCAEIQISRAVAFGTLPSRFHTLLLVTYLGMNLAYCFVLDYSQPKPVYVAEMRGRSGALAVFNFIPAVLFAMRNNPFIPLMRVSYDTFNLLHRWTARILILESTIHTIAFAVNWVDANGIKALGPGLTSAGFHLNGFLAILFMSLMAIQAWAPVRHAFYETFVNIHRLLAYATLGATWMHLKIGHVPQFPWIKLVLAIYILEVVARLTRTLYYNVSRKRGITSVTVEAMPSEACRLTFMLARPGTFKPGSHVHVYLPRYGLWSSHPFSVAWTEDILATSLGGAAFEKPAILDPRDFDFDRAAHSRTTVTLVARARTGMTRKLYDAAAAAPNRVLTTRGAVEGPYGSHEPLDSYGTVLLFAGGVGITHQLPHARALLAGAHAGTAAARRVVLVWSVPDAGCLRWVDAQMDALLKMPGRREILRVVVFITRPKSPKETSSNSGSVVCYPGRCNPQTVIDKALAERIGATCVTVCGPGPFMDAVRQAARRRVEVAMLDFVEEAFTY